MNPIGLVTGAGISALLSVPGQDPALSNTVLTAPHGTVDAGAAAIRVSGNLNIVALQVLNAFNIQVQGTTFGLPTVQGLPVTALTTASNVAGSAQQVAALTQPAITTVETFEQDRRSALLSAVAASRPAWIECANRWLSACAGALVRKTRAEVIVGLIA